MNIKSKIQFTSHKKDCVTFRYMSLYNDENYNRAWEFTDGRVGTDCFFTDDNGTAIGSAHIGNTERYKLFGVPI